MLLFTYISSPHYGYAQRKYRARKTSRYSNITQILRVQLKNLIPEDTIILSVWNDLPVIMSAAPLYQIHVSTRHLQILPWPSMITQWFYIHTNIRVPISHSLWKLSVGAMRISVQHDEYYVQHFTRSQNFTDDHNFKRNVQLLFGNFEKLFVNISTLHKHNWSQLSLPAPPHVVRRISK